MPDVRDGLKPSQRRILVAMNDLNLTPGASRVKCAKISGDTSGNYHPHGESVIYPTLVRMAQEWNMRHVLIDKQGNFAFGVHEYIDFPGAKYDPGIAMFGFDVCVSLSRKGRRIALRKLRPSSVGKSHRVTKEEAMEFAKSALNVKLE